MPKRLIPLLIVTLPLLPCSCSLFQQQEERERTEEREGNRIPPPLHLGSVHQIYPDRQFVLLRIIGPIPKEGTVLITHPPDGANDRVGNLIVSSGQHRRGNIIAADIRSGTVIQGDRVFQYRNISQQNNEEEETDTETTETDTSGETDDTIQELPSFDSAPVITDVGTPTGASAVAAPTLSSTGTPPAESPSEPPPAAAPTQTPLAPASPAAPNKLDDIPDHIDDWN